MRLAARAALLASVCLTAAVAALAATAASAPLAGSVSGPDGLRLPGAIITLTNTTSRQEIRSVTGPSGLFVVDGLEPGTYEVLVELEGFASRRISNVQVGGPSPLALDIELDLASLRERVEVVGTGPRDALELSDIRQLPAKDVTDALTERAGLTRLRKAGIGGDVVLRGLQSRDLTVVIDGQRVQGACPNHMDPPSFHVDLAEVQRVEIGKGPFDVRNQGSLGGVINVVTQRPSQGWHGLFNLAAGSDSYVNPSATASFGNPSVSALVGASYRRGNAYEDGSGRPFTALANYRAEVADLEAFSVGTAWTRFAWTPRAGHTMQLSYTRQDAGLVLYPYLQMDALNDDADRAGLRYEVADAPGAWSAVALQLYATQVAHWMTDRHRQTSATAPRDYSMGTDASTRALGGKLEGRWHGLSLGAEAFQKRWDTTTLLAMRQYLPQRSLADARQDSVGLYAEGARALGATAALELGARVDRVQTRVSDAGANVALYRAYHGTTSTRASDILGSGKARLVWALPGGMQLAGGVGRSARAPDQEERYFALSRMGTDWVGNPALRPTSNTGLEAGFELARRGLQLGVSAFAWWLDDFIIVRDVTRLAMAPGVMNARARTFVNVDASMRGLEVNATLPLVTRITLSSTLAWQRGTGRGATPGDLAEIPPARATASLRYDDGRVGLALDAVAAARQDHVDAALKESPTPGYVVLHARANVRRGKVTLVAGVTNLFDRLYAEHLSYQRDPFRSGVRVFEPGRSLYLNASVGF